MSSGRRQGNPNLGVAMIMTSEEVESEFSLGQVNGGIQHNRNERANMLVQENAEPISINHKSLKPKPIVQNTNF
jgi:hypothetical protein